MPCHCWEVFLTLDLENPLGQREESAEVSQAATWPHLWVSPLSPVLSETEGPALLLGLKMQVQQGQEIWALWAPDLLATEQSRGISL